jgi:hypothetical protein
MDDKVLPVLPLIAPKGPLIVSCAALGHRLVGQGELVGFCVSVLVAVDEGEGCMQQATLIHLQRS